jgi:hypothetical protein
MVAGGSCVTQPPQVASEDALIGAKWPKRAKITSAVVLARADGRPIRLISSRYIISMFAWSPVGHRLAYTTSGFPSPHQLLVVDRPTANPKPLFVTVRHFDWVTWSLDARRLLVDDEHKNRWAAAFNDWAAVGPRSSSSRWAAALVLSGECV